MFVGVRHPSLCEADVGPLLPTRLVLPGKLDGQRRHGRGFRQPPDYFNASQIWPIDHDAIDLSSQPAVPETDEEEEEEDDNWGTWTAPQSAWQELSWWSSMWAGGGSSSWTTWVPETWENSWWWST